MRLTHEVANEMGRGSWSVLPPFWCTVSSTYMCVYTHYTRVCLHTTVKAVAPLWIADRDCKLAMHENKNIRWKELCEKEDWGGLELSNCSSRPGSDSTLTQHLPSLLHFVFLTYCHVYFSDYDANILWFCLTDNRNTRISWIVFGYVGLWWHLHS